MLAKNINETSLELILPKQTNFVRKVFFTCIGKLGFEVELKDNRIPILCQN